VGKNQDPESGINIPDPQHRGYQMKNPPKGRVTRPINIGRAHRRSLNKTSCRSRIYTIRIRVLGALILADLSRALGKSKRLKT